MDRRWVKCAQDRMSQQPEHMKRLSVLYEIDCGLTLQMKVFLAKEHLLFLGVPTAEGLERARLLLPYPTPPHPKALSFPKFFPPFTAVSSACT